MVLSFIVYTLLLLLSLKMAINYSKLSYSSVRFTNPNIIGIILIYSIVCGLRYDVGVDYLSYWNIYDDIYRFKCSSELNLQEPGWSLFTRFFAEHRLHFSLYFTVIAYIQIFLIIASFKKYPQLLPYVIWAFYCLWFSFSQNILRQSIIVFLFLYLTMNINQIKTPIYIVIALFAILIHKSAFIIILLYPFIKIKTTLPKHTHIFAFLYVLLSILGQAADLFQILLKIPYLETILSVTQFDFYLTSNSMDQGMDRGVGLGFIMKILTNVVLIILSNRKYYKGSIKNIGTFFWLYYTSICISALAPTSILLGRPLLYLSILGIPLYVQILYQNMKNMGFIRITSTPYLLIQNKKNIFLSLIIIFSVTVLFYMGNVVKPEGGNMEYHLCL